MPVDGDNEEYGSCTITEIEDEPEPEPEPPSKPTQASHPPADCESVTEDGGVLKKVLVAGQGPSPPMHARCLVHYVGRLAETGEVIMDTRTESQTMQPVHVVAGLKSVSKESGLNLAVGAMQLGEKAMVYVEDPAYGYGEQGSFSFPAVPPSARIVYEVELVDWEEAEEEGGDAMQERSGLLFEERLERAEKRRLQGNELFSDGKFKEALGKYAVALSYLDEDLMMQLEGTYIEQAHAVKVPIHLNMAACQIRIEDYHTAIYNCTEVLTMEPENVKAFFRRGKSRLALGQSEQAAEDLESAYKRSPEDKSILKELHALRQTLKAERQAQSSLFKGQFGAAPTPVPPAQGQGTTAPTLKPGGPDVDAPARGRTSSRGIFGLISYMCTSLMNLVASLFGVRVPVAAQPQRS